MRIVGFAYMVRAVLDIVDTMWDARSYPTDGIASWLVTNFGPKIPILVLEDLKHWHAFRQLGAPYGVVLAKVEWLERHEVRCLDVVREGPHQRRQLLRPEMIVAALTGSTDYVASRWDRWATRGSYHSTCAGCVSQAKCKALPVSDRRCEHYSTKDDGTWYERFGLGQLIHRSLSQCNEDLLLISPEEIWYSVFDLAISRDKGRKSRWIQNYGRAMRGAGAEKRGLQGIVAWVDKHGAQMVDLAQCKQWPTTALPTKADVKLAYQRIRVQQSTKES